MLVYANTLTFRGTGAEAAPVICGDLALVGGNDGNLRALVLADGSERWRFAAGGAIKAGPAIAGAWLVVTSADGAVYGLDTGGGR